MGGRTTRTRGGVNFREGWRGYRWQGRFFSCPMDEAHAERALRYVENNPVRAGMVERAEEWPWSSAAGHVAGRPDGLTVAAPFASDAESWRERLRLGTPTDEANALRESTRTGRPWAALNFVEKTEAVLNRTLRRQSPGRKPKAEPPDAGRAPRDSKRK